MWWVKLLAKHQACNSNELYDRCLDKTVSVLEQEEYVKAVEYSIAEESMTYVKVANKIEQAILQKRRDNSYEECEAFMRESIERQRREKTNALSKQWHDYEQEADAFAQLKNNKGKFFGNKILGFILELLVWAVGVYAGVMMLMAADFDI